MFARKITEKLVSYGKQYKAIALVGPRQSGKTTLSKLAFPEYGYVSLENPDVSVRVQNDPIGFLNLLKGNYILDEIQNHPDLLSYIQGILDDDTDQRRFVLTGSNSLQLNQSISQSLAGRVRLLTILPLLRSELPKQDQPSSLDDTLWSGGYPRIFNEGLHVTDWCSDYYATYLQKDVRNLLNVTNLTQFDRFIRVAAGRAGQLTEFSAIGGEVGISHPTAIKWTSVLEASFIIFRLQPHFRNFNKRIIKSSKLYFFDTGLLCYLLRIRTPEQLSTHPLRGAIFENYVIAEVYKRYAAVGEEPPIYFWRDQHGHEIDLILDHSDVLYPIEIKSGTTFQDEWVKNIDWLNKLQDRSEGTVIYGGSENFAYKSSHCLSWQALQDLKL